MMGMRSATGFRLTVFIALSLVLLLATPFVSSAQSNFGSIRGQVIDETGAAIPGAAVTITEVGTRISFKAQTGPQGYYVAPSLRPVNFDVMAEAPGFKSTTISGVKVDTARESRVDITLSVGAVTERIDVSAEAPVLQTETGTLARTVDQRTIVDTPLNGRNAIELALTLPAVAGSPGSEISGLGTNDPIPGRELSINGGRIGSTQFYADGASVTSIALARTSVSFTPDTIQEFTIQQSNYSAQYAQAGGAIIQQTTKSGTNDPHGTLYWFHRQKAFSANPFSAARTSLLGFDSRPPLRRQQIGAAGGGPVYIPKLYDGRNKTFFFLSYEPTRQLEGNPAGATFGRVPTDLELSGDFSQSLIYFRDAQGNITTQPVGQLYNQFVRRADGTLAMRPNPKFNPALPVSGSNPRFMFNNFPLFNPNDPDPARRGRVLVDETGQSYVNPVSARIARELFPRPNITDPTAIANELGANFVYFRTTDYKDNRYTVRLDHRLTDNHLIYGRFTDQPMYGDRSFRDPLQNGLISDRNTSRQALVAWNGAFSPTLVNEARANYVFGNFDRNFPSVLLNRDLTTEYLDIGGPGRGAPNLLGYGSARFTDRLRLYTQTGQTSGRPYEQLGFSEPQNVGRNTEHTWAFSDDLTWVRAAHTLRMGVQGSFLQLNQANLGIGALAGGRFVFGRDQTADRRCSAAPFSGNISGCSGSVQGGNEFATYLIGIANWTQTQSENLSNPYYYRWYNYAFYFQDDWKATPNLTLNLGLRYQFQSPRWEKNNLQGQMNLSRLEPNPFLPAPLTNNLAPVFEFAGVKGRSKYMVNPQRWDFEPRFGFAWTPPFDWNGDKKLVIRGGYGITHATLMGNDREPVPNVGSQTFTSFRAISYTYGSNDFNAPTNFPTCGLARCNEVDVPMQFGFNNPVLMGDPSLFIVPQSGEIRPGDPSSVLDVNGNLRQDVRWRALGFIGDPNFRTPTIQQYNLMVQYQFMTNTVASVGYQGSRGTHLFGPDINVNRIDPITGERLIKGFDGRFSNGAIYLLSPTGSASTYHALVGEVERRFHQGLQFRFNYTYSKLLDDSSGGVRFPLPNNSFSNATYDLPLTRNQNPYDSRAERSVSSYDTPHAVNIVTFWEVPVGQGKRFLNRGGAVNHILGDWQISAIGRGRSGYPVSVELGRSISQFDTGTGGGPLRPDVVPGVPLKNPDWTPENAEYTPYLDPRAFAWPMLGQYGNAPRNFSQLRLPWVNTMNASFHKRIRPFKEAARYFELRAEVFNIFNHKTFGIPNSGGGGLYSTGAQNVLLSSSIVPEPVPGVQDRYLNSRLPEVREALYQQLRGVPVDDAITALPGPGTGGLGCPSSAAELKSTTGMLSPACAARELSYNTGFYVFDSSRQNQVAPRIFQFALKFYF